VSCVLSLARVLVGFVCLLAKCETDDQNRRGARARGEKHRSDRIGSDRSLNFYSFLEFLDRAMRNH
jgi:hypothetical protein